MKSNSQGYALVATILMLSVVMSLLAAFMTTSRIELAATLASKDSISGYYAAEAGLNVRADTVKAILVNSNTFSGVSPAVSNPCTGTNMGSGDYGCQSLVLGNHEVFHYLEEDAANPLASAISPGELFQNLSMMENRYSVHSLAKGRGGVLNASMEMEFKRRQIPLFQFAAFYNKDLEILTPGGLMLNGPVFSTGDLYIDSLLTLTLSRQIGSVGGLYRGRKDSDVCHGNTVSISDSVTPKSLIPACSQRRKLNAADVSDWNGMIRLSANNISSPNMSILDASAGSPFWDKADIRLVLHLDSLNNVDSSNVITGVEVRDAGGVVAVAQTGILNDGVACPGSIGESLAGANDGKVVGNSQSLYSYREGKLIRMLEVDVRGLLECLHQTSFLSTGKLLNDSTDGGLVFFLSVDGPNSTVSSSGYGVRLRNAAILQATTLSANKVQGISFVSDQAVFSQGNFNSDPTQWIPASIIGDTYNVLSGSWNDLYSTSWLQRLATDTVVKAGIIAGTDTTGGIEGIGGQNGVYAGGLEEFPRFYEQWDLSPKKTFTFRGSMVSLGNPRHSSGAWSQGNPRYSSPQLDWDFEQKFNSKANLPPLTPELVYIKQEMYSRHWNQ